MLPPARPGRSDSRDTMPRDSAHRIKGPHHNFHYPGSFHFNWQLHSPGEKCLTSNNYVLNPHCYNHLLPLLHDSFFFFLSLQVFYVRLHFGIILIIFLSAPLFCSLFYSFDNTSGLAGSNKTFGVIIFQVRMWLHWSDSTTFQTAACAPLKHIRGEHFATSDSPRVLNVVDAAGLFDSIREGRASVSEPQPWVYCIRLHFHYLT